MRTLRLLLVVILVSSTLVSHAQKKDDVIARRLVAQKTVVFRNDGIDSIKKDTSGWLGRVRSLPTADAIYKFVAGRMGGGGGGSQTLEDVLANGNTADNSINLLGNQGIFFSPSTDPSENSGIGFTTGGIRVVPFNGSSNVADLKFDLLTAARTYTFPNASGTIALTTDIPATPNLNTVLAQGGVFTTNRTVDLNNYYLSLVNAEMFVSGNVNFGNAFGSIFDFDDGNVDIYGGYNLFLAGGGRVDITGDTVNLIGLSRFNGRVDFTTYEVHLPNLSGVDPGGDNGDIYYNTTTNKFRAFENGAWTNMIGAGGGSSAWGSITGTLSSQTDLQTALNGKQSTLTNSAGLAGALSDETGTGLSVFNTSPSFANKVTVTGATETTSNPVLDATQTWNNAATAFIGKQTNITNTASASGSYVERWQVNSADVLKLSTGGNLYVGGGVWSSTGTTQVGFTAGASNRLMLYGGGSGSQLVTIVGAEFNVGSGMSYGWTSASAPGSGTADTRLWRDGAPGIAALRLSNGGGSNEFRIYNLYTDASNTEFLSIGSQNSTNVHQIASEAIGAGVVRDIEINSGAANTRITKIAGTGNRMVMADASGNVTATIIPYTDGSTTSSATITPTGNARENVYKVTALATNPTIAAPSGTYAANNKVILIFKDDGTPRTFTWNSIYRGSSSVALPSGTTAGKILKIQFSYNTQENTFDIDGLIDGI